MLRIVALLILLGAGCSHAAHQCPQAAVGRLPAATDPTAANLDLPPPESLPDLSAVRLGLKQVPSNSDVILEFALTNVGHLPVTITSNPGFGLRSFDGGREDEFELQLLDARGRWVPFRCTDCRLAMHQAEVAALQPGQTRTYSFSLMPACYSLVPGERLSFIATYANLFERDPRRRLKDVPVVHAASWIEIVVPAGWADRGAAQQGVAAPNATPTRT
jgi:hypothetical protein